MIYGMDYLGGAMYGSMLLKAHPAGFAAGFFADTFGNCFPVIDKLCATGKCPVVRVHGPWTNHSYNPARHDKAIFAAFDKVRALRQKYPGIDFQFSPVCESDGRGKAWQNLFAELYNRDNAIQLVCSIYKGEHVRPYLLEIHGNKPAPSTPYQYGYDGKSAVDSNVEDDKKTYRAAQIIWLWHPAFNLKYKVKLSGDESAQVKKNDSSPPKERHCKPTPELIQSLAVLAGAKGATSLKPRNLWKSHADRGHTPIESRAYKPVLISPQRAASATLVDANGSVVAKSAPPTKYHDGRWTYRFDKYGYQIATRVLTVLAGKTVLGTVNAPFREGEYRS